jgi:hypothetical protein
LRYAVDGAGDEHLLSTSEFHFVRAVNKEAPLRNCCIQILNNPNAIIVSFKWLFGPYKKLPLSQIPKL